MPQGEVNRAYLIELMRKIADLPPERAKVEVVETSFEIPRLSDSMTDILMCIYDNGPVRANVVTEWVGLPYNTVAMYSSRLRDRGLIAGDKLESPGNPMEWYCTPYGCEVVEAIVKRLRGKAS